MIPAIMLAFARRQNVHNEKDGNGPALLPCDIRNACQNVVADSHLQPPLSARQDRDDGPAGTARVLAAMNFEPELKFETETKSRQTQSALQDTSGHGRTSMRAETTMGLERAVVELGYSAKELLDILQAGAALDSQLLATLQKQLGTGTIEEARARLEDVKEELCSQLKKAGEDNDGEGKQKSNSEVKERLKEMGTCPVGFDWLEVEGGYRCAGGSHFMSHDEAEKL
eukprot:CAMPEP_0196750862 /NCGR_PEP_ID=MMETSP1091-20130531/81858_1 /TAXON_ID=302021 /ORGANISM="Rhodomonas sp., Strain CCMP768" /LENGTH=226 /DNA_ID=CAMNT_0042098543 /DNA_START=84 /DNA_END=764 /DNA_ORIENTATION=+